jgi:hypothetical protein
MNGDSLTVATFTKGFIAHLVELGETAIYPKADQDRRGFESAIRTLEQEIVRLKRSAENDDRDLYKSLVLIRNDLQASNTGAFDSLETAFRNLQLNFTNCPNPFYEEISFTVSPSFAKSLLEDLPEKIRNIVVKVADSFRESRRAAAS